MKNKEFYDANHANLYLVNSIIRVDGVPVYITNVQRSRKLSKITIHYNLISNRENTEETIPIDSKRIDMNPVPLGFINFTEFGKPKTIISAYRIPARQWRIGLTSNNLKLIPNCYNGAETKRKIIQSIYFKRSVCGEFPNVKKVIKMIKDKEAISQAFSRSFAMEREKLRFIQLAEPVGELFKGEIMLFDDYLYLSQLLEQDL